MKLEIDHLTSKISLTSDFLNLVFIHGPVLHAATQFFEIRLKTSELNHCHANYDFVYQKLTSISVVEN